METREPPRAGSIFSAAQPILIHPFSFMRLELTIGELVSKSVYKTLILALVLTMPLDRLGLGQERAFSRITYENFKCLCDKYDILAQDTYESTDYFRFKSIIEVLTQRKQDGCAFLEKTELQILAEWRR